MATKTAPGPTQYLPLPYGLVANLRRDPLSTYTAIAREHGDVSRIRVGPMVSHLLVHPDHVKRVLLDRYENYPRSRLFGSLKIVLGEGLVCSDGEPWKRDRRLLQPSFVRARVLPLVPEVVAATERMLDRWRTISGEGRAFDVAREMMRLTLVVVGNALLGVELEGQADALGDALTEALEYVYQRTSNPLMLPTAVPTARNLRLRRALAVLDRFAHDLIASRGSGAAGRHDRVTAALAGSGLPADRVRDHILTFLVAGNETTANALTWAWHLLSQNPEVTERLEGEVDRALGGRTPNADDLPALDYARRVVEESMRLYPPVWATVRDAVEPDEMGGYAIPPGSTILLCQYLTHRHPEFWPDPERFDPDRFLPENADGRPKYAYFPFLGGPHVCIGQDFALMEGTLILAMVAQRYRLHPVPGHPVEPQPHSTLRPRHGLQMTLSPR
jgi:cytochrome P450